VSDQTSREIAEMNKKELRRAVAEEVLGWKFDFTFEQDMWVEEPDRLTDPTAFALFVLPEIAKQGCEYTYNSLDGNFAIFSREDFFLTGDRIAITWYSSTNMQKAGLRAVLDAHRKGWKR